MRLRRLYHYLLPQRSTLIGVVHWYAFPYKSAIKAWIIFCIVSQLEHTAWGILPHWHCYEALYNWKLEHYTNTYYHKLTIFCVTHLELTYAIKSNYKALVCKCICLFFSTLKKIFITTEGLSQYLFKLWCLSNVLTLKTFFVRKFKKKIQVNTVATCSFF